MSTASGGAAAMSMAMTDIPIIQISRPKTVPNHAAASVTAWIGLAAAPTFVIMAFWSAYGSQTDMLCTATQDSSPMSGMTLMYLLMAAFHTGPWLKLIPNWRNQG